MSDPVTGAAPAGDPRAEPLPGVDPLRAVVSVMDVLRSPGGCPWDAEQTHRSLVPYAIEEAHEVAEAVEAGDRAGLCEELGDLLLQVVFHARLAEEDPDEPFGIDDVAAGLIEKLVRRHPHVFGDATVADADGVNAQWQQIKATEKHRASALDGVPATLGALARTQKLAHRARRAGLDVAPAAGPDPADAVPGGPVPGAPAPDPAAGLGERLLALVLQADRDGVDAEGALRRAAAAWEARARAAEADAGRGAADDGATSAPA